MWMWMYLFFLKNIFLYIKNQKKNKNANRMSPESEVTSYFVDVTKVKDMKC